MDGDFYCWYDNECGFVDTLLEHVLAASASVARRAAPSE
jgi:hypothetical protein